MVNLNGIFYQFINFGEILYQLEYYGLYDFILPFLLLFAVVYGVLSYMKIFNDQRGVHIVVALVVAMLATRFPFFSDFLNFVSPRIGVGLVILLTLLILIGLFTPEKQQAVIGGVFIAIGVIVFLVILGQAYNIFGFGGGYFTSDVISGLILIALIIGVIVAIAVAGGKGSKRSSVIKKLAPLWEE